MLIVISFIICYRRYFQKLFLFKGQNTQLKLKKPYIPTNLLPTYPTYHLFKHHI